MSERSPYEPPFSVGQVLIAERTFTEADVLAFAQVSRDLGRHHLQADARGRILVHGLLTATLATEVGGALNFIARTMNYEFLKAVFVGDHIRCAVTFVEVREEPKRIHLRAEVACTNEEGVVVLTGSTEGIVRIPAA